MAPWSSNVNIPKKNRIWSVSDLWELLSRSLYKLVGLVKFRFLMGLCSPWTSSLLDLGVRFERIG